MNMSGMGPDYEWYVSGLSLDGDVGVLLLSHGVGENSDRMFRDAVRPLSDQHPTAIGFGMAMMNSAHLQSAVDDLVARGAQTIVLVQTTSPTEHNSLTRQWRYIFGLEKESAYLAVPRVQADANFIFADHYGDHPLITEILYAHARQASRNPGDELLILVGHGPEDIEDNVQDLAILDAHVQRIRAKGEFAEVKLINLQDDGLPPIRESNVRKLRKWIKAANRQDRDVIVVAVATASHGVQTHIRQDLRGLQYTFADKGLAEHSNYIEWIAASIDEALAKR
jgi:hypothetical protein